MNHVEDILMQAIQTHLKKRHDYTTNPTENPYENFTRSSEIASWFPSKYNSFTVLIGTKLARLGALLSSNREPLNESVEDSFKDLVTYCALMYGFYKSNQNEDNLLSEKWENPDRNYIPTAQEMYNKTTKPIGSYESCIHRILDMNGYCKYCGTVVPEVAIAKQYIAISNTDGYQLR